VVVARKLCKVLPYRAKYITALMSPGSHMPYIYVVHWYLQSITRRRYCVCYNVNFNPNFLRVDRELRKLQLQIYLRFSVKYDSYCGNVRKLVPVLLLLFVNNSRTEIHENTTKALVADTGSQKEDRRMDGHVLREVLSAPCRKITSQFQCKVTNIFIHSRCWEERKQIAEEIILEHE